MFEKEEFTPETQVSEAVMSNIEALLSSDNYDRYAEIGRSLSLS